MLDSSKKNRNEAEGSVVAEYHKLHDIFSEGPSGAQRDHGKKFKNFRQATVSNCVPMSGTQVCLKA